MIHMNTLPNDPQPWKVLDRRYVLDRRPYMYLREDTVLLPNGSRIDDFFVFEYPDWVSTVAITKTGEFVLIRQYRHGIGAVYYELVAGVAEKEYSLLENAQRELLEETGYGGGEWQAWMQISANPSTHTNISHIFLATGVERVAEQHLETTEDIVVHVLPAAEVLRLLRAGEMFQALHQAALWRYFAEVGL